MPILVVHWVVVGDRQEAERWAPLFRFCQGSKLSQRPRSAQHPAPGRARGSPGTVSSTWVVSQDPQVHLQALEKLMMAASRISCCNPRSKIRPKSSNFMASSLAQAVTGSLDQEPPLSVAASAVVPAASRCARADGARQAGAGVLAFPWPPGRRQCVGNQSSAVQRFAGRRGGAPECSPKYGWD